MTLKEELVDLENALGIIQYKPCSMKEDKEYKHMIKSGEKLPENIIKDTNGTPGYYRVIKSDVTDIELDKLIKFRQTTYLKTIKNCVVFFTVLYVLSMLVAIFVGLSVLS